MAASKQGEEQARLGEGAAQRQRTKREVPGTATLSAARIAQLILSLKGMMLASAAPLGAWPAHQMARPVQLPQVEQAAEGSQPGESMQNARCVGSLPLRLLSYLLARDQAGKARVRERQLSL